MSDGLTEARRSMRKGQYLNGIELKKDELFDYYKSCVNDLMIITNNILYHTTSDVNIFNKKKPNYQKIEEQKIQLIIVKTKMEETQKLINKLDISYKEALEKPSREF